MLLRAFAFLILLAGPAFAEGVMVERAYAYETTATARAGAAYLTLMNHGVAADRLVEVRGDVAKRIEIHETVDEDGVMKMRGLKDGLPLPAGETVEMAPGGLHVMLMGLTAPLSKGEAVALTLVLESGAEMQVTAPVIARGEGHAQGHGHKHGEGHEESHGHGHAKHGETD